MRNDSWPCHVLTSNHLKTRFVRIKSNENSLYKSSIYIIFKTVFSLKQPKQPGIFMHWTPQLFGSLSSNLYLMGYHKQPNLVSISQRMYCSSEFTCLGSCLFHRFIQIYYVEILKQHSNQIYGFPSIYHKIMKSEV